MHDSVSLSEYFRPIATIPEELKDGRAIYGLNIHAARHLQRFAMQYDAGLGRWYSQPGYKFRKPTHYVQIP